MYRIGDYVVKPNTGICEIGDIVILDLAGTGEKEYYLLHPISDKKSVLYVTVEADRSRLRLAMNKEEALAFINKMPEIEEAWIENDKIREQKYKAALRTNEAADLVSIIKNMHVRGMERIAAGKKITATDEKYFQQAEGILFAELEFALEETKEQIKERISAAIGKEI